VNGHRRLSGNGYRRITVAGEERFEHQVVMEQMLERPLLPFETVHHRNGIRADNRPENLELWATAHPAGTRVEDLVEWVVTEYADRVRERLVSEPSR
jgi:HNH endonuclease